MKLFKFIFNFRDYIFSLIAGLIFLLFIISIVRDIFSATISIITVLWFVLFLNLMLVNVGVSLRRAGIEMENNHLKGAGNLFLWTHMLVLVITIIQKIYGKYEEKKVGVAGLQPTLFLHDYSKLSN